MGFQILDSQFTVNIEKTLRHGKTEKVLDSLHYTF
jgi:hypothetical protein